MKLSNQALGCLMVALQEAIMNQKDIIPVLKNFEFVVDSGDPDSSPRTAQELSVANPPTVMSSTNVEGLKF